MLKFKLGEGQTIHETKTLIPKRIYFYDNKKSEIIIETIKPHFLKSGDEIIFNRTIGGILYEASKKVTVLGFNKLKIDAFDDLILTINSASKEWVKLNLNTENEYVERLALILNFNEEHTFSENEYIHFDEEIDEFYNIPMDESENYGISERIAVDEEKRRCGGDLVKFYDFVYETETGLTKNNRSIIIEDSFVNTDNVVLSYDLYGEKYVLGYSELPDEFFDLSGNTLTGVTEEINGFVPALSNNTEDTHSVLFFYPYNNSDTANDYEKSIINKYDNVLRGRITDDDVIVTELTYPDNRFFTISDDLELEMVGETIIYSNNYHYGIQIPISKNIGIDLEKENNVKNVFFEKVKNDSINPIIDYEKQMFSPMILEKGLSPTKIKLGFKDSWLRPATAIKFNLHFRKREDVINADGEILKEWVTKDELFWNGLDIDEDGNPILPSDKESSVISYLKSNGISDTTLIKNESKSYINYPDLLGDLNFDDDDVFFQKSRLKKSFIRLSFYDTPDKRTQALQFYSTIFLDSGKCFTKYIKLRNNNTENNFLTLTEFDMDSRLGTEFEVTNKFDTSASSEGFYLYLFPQLVKGKMLTDLYMKVEFNHAKYGRTIPFILPTTRDNFIMNRINPNTKNENGEYVFPFHYLTNNNDGVRMSDLRNDQYINLKIKYDFDKKQYVWFFPYNDIDGNIITLDLWEPRMNGIETIGERDNIDIETFQTPNDVEWYYKVNFDFVPSESNRTLSGKYEVTFFGTTDDDGEFGKMFSSSCKTIRCLNLLNALRFTPESHTLDVRKPLKYKFTCTVTGVNLEEYEILVTNKLGKVLWDCRTAHVVGGLINNITCYSLEFTDKLEDIADIVTVNDTIKTVTFDFNVKLTARDGGENSNLPNESSSDDDNSTLFQYRFTLDDDWNVPPLLEKGEVYWSPSNTNSKDNKWRCLHGSAKSIVNLSPTIYWKMTGDVLNCIPLTSPHSNYYISFFVENMSSNNAITINIDDIVCKSLDDGKNVIIKPTTASFGNVVSKKEYTIAANGGVRLYFLMEDIEMPNHVYREFEFYYNGIGDKFSIGKVKFYPDANLQLENY